MTDGISFEKLAERIYKQLTEGEKHTKVEHNVKLPGRYTKRQFDVVLTSHIARANLEIVTVIECRDKSRPITIEAIDGFHSKMGDVNANKGVMISQAGFTASMKEKAKDLGIEIYTAHEALSDKWGIDIEIPVLVIEWIPKMKPNIQYDIKAGQTFKKDQMCIINGIDIFADALEQWNNLTISPDQEGTEIDLTPKNLVEPYYIEDVEGSKVPVKSFRLMCRVEAKYYKGFLNEHEGTTLLKDHQTGQLTIIADLQNVLGYEDRFEEISTSNFRTTSEFIICIATKHNMKIKGPPIMNRPVRIG